MDLFSSALKLAKDIRRRVIGVEEVTKIALERMDRLNPKIGAVVYRRDELALKKARDMDQILENSAKGGEPLPPFFGVPILIKDLTEVAGDIVTHGSRAFRSKIGQYDATIVRRIFEAGFVHVGRTNSSEFGSLPVSENELHPPTRNPHNLEHTAGGSSGGAAAAVAAKMVPLAHASDGGGSIRIPASACGLIGLKAQRARVPKGPFITEILHGISTDGVITHDVADTAAFLDTVAFRDPDAWFGIDTPQGFFSEALKSPTGKLKIAYTSQGPVNVPIDAVCIKAMESILDRLKYLGHDIIEVKVPWSDSGEQLMHDFISLWASASAYMPEVPANEISPFAGALRDHGRSQNSFGYVQAVGRLQMLSKRFLSHMRQSWNVLITPTLATQPPKIGWHFQGVNQKNVYEMMLKACYMTPFTCFANITGQPAISIPSIESEDGLPIGVHIMGLPFEEPTLLKLARDLSS